MMQENLDEVLGEFKDGVLTRGEYRERISNLRKKKDYLPSEEYNRLVRLAEKDVKALTKKQFVQCVEFALFAATGVTRD